MISLASKICKYDPETCQIECAASMTRKMKGTCDHPSPSRGPQLKFEVFQQSRVLVLGNSEKSTVHAGGLVHPMDQQRRWVPDEKSGWTREGFFHHRHQNLLCELHKIQIRSARRRIVKIEKCTDPRSTSFNQLNVAAEHSTHTCNKTRFADSLLRLWSGLQLPED